jgi:hypothetical protein
MKQMFRRAITRLEKPARCSFKIVAGIFCATAIGMVVWDNLQALGNIARSTNSDSLGGHILQSTSTLAGISGGALDLSSITSQMAAAAIGTLLTIIAGVLWPDAEWMIPWGADR